MGRITLIEQNQQLQEVAVVGRKVLFEQKSDRLIVNVGSLPTFSGNNGLQVLQKAPGVVVQENLNSISLNNKGEVLIMINNRVSRVPPGTLIQQLKGMRAENIDRIELFHQPSAKYDANNAAGIIHIILKEQDMYGLNGNASLTVGMGQRAKFIGSADVNYRKNNWNLYANVTGSKSTSPMWFVNHFREYEYEGDHYFYENELNFTNPVNNSLNLNVGVDYEINKDNTLGVLFGRTKSDMAGNDFTSESEGKINGITNTTSEFLLDMDNPNQVSFLNLNYFSKLSPNKSLNIDLDRVSTNVENSSDLRNLDPEEEIERSLAERESEFEIYRVAGDFKWTSEKGDQLDTGVKGTFNNSNTVSHLANFNNGTATENESFRTNDDISETILAIYASFQETWDAKWESNLGARLEQYKYELTDRIGENDFEINYTNFFPVIRTSYSIDSTQSVTLSLNRRIERPAFFNLAGFYLLIDPSLFVNSNTRLRPSFTNALRLAYNRRSILIVLEINRTIGAIAFYNTVDKENGLQTSTPINFDHMDGLMLNLSFPIKIGQFWKMNWNLDGSYKKVMDASNRPLPFKKSLFTVTAQLTNVFELGSNWTANIDGRYMSPFISGDQEQYVYP